MAGLREPLSQEPQIRLFPSILDVGGESVHANTERRRSCATGRSEIPSFAMPHHVFFSWQSDTPNGIGRSFVEDCLRRAITQLRVDAEVEPANRELAIDRDTLDVPGSPPIMETIFGKIERAAVFVADLTYVAERAGGARAPNPNVCIEHGYALRALGWRRLVAVMNTAQGHPDRHELPFDVRHTRRPILYDLAEDLGGERRQVIRDRLSKELAAAIKAVLADIQASAAIPGPPSQEPHPHDVELLDRIHRQFSPGLRRFLHRHNFGTPFLRSALDPILEMNSDWVGATFEFQDATLQDAFARLRHTAEVFGDLMLSLIHAMPKDTRIAGVKTEQDAAQGTQPGTVEAVRDLNAGAAELSSAIDGFDRLARDRIRVASGAHAVQTSRPADGLSAAAYAALEELASDVLRGNLEEVVTRPRVTLRLVPLRSAERHRLDPRRVAEARLQFPPSVDTLSFPASDGRQWWCCSPHRLHEGRPNPEVDWRMRLVRPGYLEYQATIGERIGDDTEILVDGRRLECTIVTTLEHMARIAEGLGLGGAALIGISMDGVEEVQLTRARQGGRRIRRPEVMLPPAFVDDVGQPLATALQEQLDMIWQTVGWADGSPWFSGQEWAGYSDGSNYGP